MTSCTRLRPGLSFCASSVVRGRSICSKNTFKPFHWNTLTLTTKTITGNHPHTQDRYLETIVAPLLRRFFISVLSVTNESKVAITYKTTPFLYYTYSHQLLFLNLPSSSRPIWYIHKKLIEFSSRRWWWCKARIIELDRETPFRLGIFLPKIHLVRSSVSLSRSMIWAEFDKSIQRE